MNRHAAIALLVILAIGLIIVWRVETWRQATVPSEPPKVLQPAKPKDESRRCPHCGGTGERIELELTPE